MSDFFTTRREAAAARGRPYGRHPVIVTADRLRDTAIKWGDRISDAELEALHVTEAALRRVGNAETARRAE